MFGAYTTYCALPAALARYMATSADRSSSSATVPSAMPTLARHEDLAALDVEGRLQRRLRVCSAASTALGDASDLLDEDARTRRLRVLRDRVARRQRIPQTGADAAQERVTRDMTETVVHGP